MMASEHMQVAKIPSLVVEDVENHSSRWFLPTVYYLHSCMIENLSRMKTAY